jgi:hypothetical protein
MVKISFFLIFLGFTSYTQAQVKPVTQKVNKVIIPAKAISIRKDVNTLRIQLAQMSDSINLIKEEVDELAKEKDSISEMGEMESLRLQMAMDRLSKMMSTLSNLMKKTSDTQQAITQNIK